MSVTHKICLGDEVFNTTVICSTAKLKECLDEFVSTIIGHMNSLTMNTTVVGFDIEKMFIYNSSSTTNDHYPEKVAILKLCYEKTCLIIQLHRMTHPFNSLSSFLHLPWLMFVGVRITGSLKVLERVYNVKCRNVVDLGHLCATVNKNDRYRFYGFLEFARNVPGMDDKRACFIYASSFTNWGVEILSESQIVAATCYLCFHEGNRTIDQCFN